MKPVQTADPNLTVYIIESSPFNRLCSIIGKAVICKWGMSVVTAFGKALINPKEGKHTNYAKAEK